MKPIRKIFALVPVLTLSTWLAYAGDIPSNQRSRAAIARVKPALTADLSRQGLQLGSPIFIRIFKQSHELELWVKEKDSFRLFRVYKICYFSGGLGPKQRLGDGQSPEGFYTIHPYQMNPASEFHLSFRLNFPNAFDKAYHRTGSDLMIHGNCVSIGCYAMTDEKIEEIFAMADAAFRGGQDSFQVHIFPFRMTAENMEQYSNSKWKDFWLNLKEGYDYFEKDKNPPDVSVSRKKYVFQDDEE